MQQETCNRRRKILNEFWPFSVVIWQFQDGTDLPIKIDPHYRQMIGRSYLGQTKEISSKKPNAIGKDMSKSWHRQHLKIMGGQKFCCFFHDFWSSWIFPGQRKQPVVSRIFATDRGHYKDIAWFFTASKTLILMENFASDLCGTPIFTQACTLSYRITVQQNDRPTDCLA